MHSSYLIILSSITLIFGWELIVNTGDINYLDELKKQILSPLIIPFQLQI